MATFINDWTLGAWEESRIVVVGGGGGLLLMLVLEATNHKRTLLSTADRNSLGVTRRYA